MSPTEALVYVAPDKGSLPAVLNNLVVNICGKAISERGLFTIALSGGSLPAFMSTLNEAFAAEGVDPKYDSWHVLLADERCVPEIDPDNNMASIKKHFLSKVSIPESQVYCIDESKLVEGADAVSKEYEGRVKELMGTSGGLLDLALLGFGPDGHTCSLFPGHALLSETTRWVAPIIDSPKPPPNRITLTLPVLNRMTRNVIFCGAGGSKKPILEANFESTTKLNDGQYNVLYATPPPFPCAMVVPTGGKDNNALIWVIDADAATGAMSN